MELDEAVVCMEFSSLLCNPFYGVDISDFLNQLESKMNNVIKPGPQPTIPTMFNTAEFIICPSTATNEQIPEMINVQKIASSSLLLRNVGAMDRKASPRKKPHASISIAAMIEGQP
jgi:hypothetical protein